MRRHLPPLVAALAALGITPVLVALPVVSPPGAAPHPVAASVVSFPIAGVDPQALAETATGALAATGPVTVGRVTVAAAPRRPAVLTARRSTTRFDLVALTWSSPADLRGSAATMSVRVREQGRWSAWQPLGLPDDGPDAGTPEARAIARRGAPGVSAPLITGGADGVQVRVDTPSGLAPAGLRVQLVDAGRSAADSPSTPASTAAADTGQPTTITRAQWGADESLVGGPPTVNDTVKAMFLHHTDTTNAYTAEQAYAQVRAVYVFHTKVRGWNDIGYNFLVDRFGRVFEGRKGSITDAVQGAHTGGFNEQSLGVAVLGTFTSVKPTQAAVDGVVDVMSWKAAQYGLDPRASTTLISAGSGYTKYPAGAPLTLKVISGHRDADLTDCPGKAFYPMLPAIRAAVTARMQPGLVSARVDLESSLSGGAPIVFAAAFPTVQRWWLSLTPVCSATAVRTLSGRQSGALAAPWNLTDDSGAAVPPGVYRMAMITSSPVGTAPAWSRDVEVLPAPGSPPAGCPVARLGSPDLYGAAVVAGRSAFPAAQSVVLAGAGAPLDALVAAPLAHAKQAPLLLTGRDTLPAAVSADLTGHGVTTAWVVGGPASVAPAVEDQLRALGVTTIVRLAGRDRYELAAAVARAVGAPQAAAVVVSGADAALSAVSAVAGEAAATDRPLLLVAPSGVPAATASALTDLKVTNVLVVGSAGAVPPSVLTRLGRLGVRTLGRVAGTDPASTAVAVVQAFSRPVPGDRVVVVPTAPASRIWTALGAAQGRLTLFTDQATLPAPTLAWLTAHKPATIALVGSPIAVATPVIRQLATARS